MLIESFEVIPSIMDRTIEELQVKVNNGVYDDILLNFDFFTLTDKGITLVKKDKSIITNAHIDTNINNPTLLGFTTVSKGKLLDLVTYESTESPGSIIVDDYSLINKKYLDQRLDEQHKSLIKTVNNILPDSSGNVHITGENILLSDIDEHTQTISEFASSILSRVIDIENSDSINIIDVIKINNVPLTITASDKSVNIPIASNILLGVVKSGDENKPNNIIVNNDGTMIVKTIKTSSLIQDPNEELILNGGSSNINK